MGGGFQNTNSTTMTMTHDEYLASLQQTVHTIKRRGEALLRAIAADPFDAAVFDSERRAYADALKRAEPLLLAVPPVGPQ